MPVFIAAIGGMLLRAIPGFVAQVLLSLGLAAVTYKGFDVAIDRYKADLLASLYQLPPDVLSLVAYLKIGQCINIIFSAMLARMAYNGMKSGAVKKLRQL